jgi:hypothetical protein
VLTLFSPVDPFFPRLYSVALFADDVPHRARDSCDYPEQNLFNRICYTIDVLALQLMDYLNGFSGYVPTWTSGGGTKPLSLVLVPKFLLSR